MPNRLTGITNGLGAQISLDYRRMTDATVYTRPTSVVPDYPVRHVQMPLAIVADQRSSDGLGGNRWQQYRYSGSRIDLKGRGWLGFSQVSVEDKVTKLKETTLYRQDFPYVGFGYSETQETTVSPLVVTAESATTFASKQVANVWFPYAAVSTEKVRELNGGQVVKSTVTENTYGDDYGNLTASTVRVYEGDVGSSIPFETFVVNTFPFEDSLNWRLGRLASTTVTRQGPNITAQTRTSEFTYDADGLLASETIEPLDNAYKVVTTYGRDGYGHITSTTVSGADFVARTATEEYGTSYGGRFNTKSCNALGHCVTRTFHGATGNPATIRDPNGPITSFQYDGFGRKTKELRPDSSWTEYKRQWCAASSPSCASGSLYKAVTKGSDGSETITEFDLLERAVAAKTRGFDGDWITQLTQYNPKGQVLRKSAPHEPFGAPYWTTYTYDGIGRIAQENAPVDQNLSSGRITSYAYLGLKTTQTNALFKTSTTIVNVLGKVVETVDDDGAKVLYAYDAFDNLVRTTDDAGNAVLMFYDIRGRKTEMRDPDLGRWLYSYNALGELITQRSAKNDLVTMWYDKLGRMTQRQEPEGTTLWTYDESWKGALASVASPSYQRSHQYDGLGRLTQAHYVIDSVSYRYSYTYDGNGRISTITYPGLFWVAQQYGTYGHLWRIARAEGPTSVALNCNALVAVPEVAEACDLVNSALTSEIWRLDATDNWGNASLFALGNGVDTIRSHDLANGNLSAIYSTAHATSVQSLNYTWDKVGNLKTRVDQNQGGLTEQFDYDDINRLTRTRVFASGTTAQTDLTITYNRIGNITSKSDVGTYRYDSGKPHAVTSVSGVNGLNAGTYSYDANGNALTGLGSRTMTWSSYNLPRFIDQGADSIEFQYGPSRERIWQVNGPLVITYAGGLYERHHSSATEKTVALNKSYVMAGGRVVAIYTKPDAAQGVLHYLHHDHRDSVDVVTDASGAVVERLSYDAFGKRRTINWLNDVANLQMLVPHDTTRGYTGQEHLDGVGLIHYGGRVYDPFIGRFTSADPIIQAPLDLQSYNRYSYVRNNPLTLTDPSGFSWWGKQVRRLSRESHRWERDFRHEIRRPNSQLGPAIQIAAVAAATYGCGPCAIPVAGATSAAVSRAQGASPRDSLKAGVISAWTAAAFYGVGQTFAGGGFAAGVERTIAYGLVGGVSSTVSGGSFRSGFVSAAITTAISPNGTSSEIVDTLA